MKNINKEIYFVPHKDKIINYSFFGFDCETITDKNDFYLASIVGDDIKKTFFNPQELIEFLQQRKFKDKCYIVATNLQFDLLALFKNNLNMIELLFRDSELITADLKDKNERKTKFIDTYNFVPFSVEKLGRIIGIPKGEKPKFLGKKPRTTQEMNELIQYNLKDSEITYKFMKFLQQGYNQMNTNIKLTVASSSITLYKNNYLQFSLKQPAKELLKTFYKGYYGGRTETFMRGKIENCRYYDINALYPFSMTKEYPNPNYMKIRRSNINLIKDYDGLTECQIIIPKGYTFLLPFKHGKEGMKKLIFPVGKISGWYSHVELRIALEHNAKIISYGKSIYYTKNFYPFKEYVKQLYGKRLEMKKINNPIELLYKLSLNSLYGKFAQKIVGKQEIIHADNMTKEMMRDFINKDFKIEMVGDYFYVTDKKGCSAIPSFINPIFSIYTTAYARLLMFEKFKDIENHFYYMDTDSLITDKHFNCSEKLGDFKKEYDIREGIIVKPKMYGFITKDDENVIRCKGIKNINDNYEKFLLLLKEQKYKYDKFIKFKESNRSKESYKYGKLNFNQIINIVKNIDLEDTKRVWKEKFTPAILQDSKPINIRFNPLINNEKKLYNITEKYKIKTFINQKRKKLFDIDTFDSKGKDINNKEFLDNEIFWALHE